MLLDVQRRFRDIVTGKTDPAAEFVTAPQGRVSRRLGVYRNNVQKSLVDVLAAAFPVVQRIVGARFFSALAQDFAVRHLPDVPHLSVYGAGFANFIAAHAHTQELPYLSDVARLEWARGEAYFAADAPALDPQHLAEMPAEALPAATFRLHSAARLVRSTYPIHRIWELHQAEGADIPQVDMSVAECVLITRPQYQVIVREVSSADAAFVAACADGENLNAAASAAMAIDDAFDLQGALQQHFVNGTFTTLGA